MYKLSISWCFFLFILDFGYKLKIFHFGGMRVVNPLLNFISQKMNKCNEQNFVLLFYLNQLNIIITITTFNKIEKYVS